MAQSPSTGHMCCQICVVMQSQPSQYHHIMHIGQWAVGGGGPPSHTRQAANTFCLSQWPERISPCTGGRSRFLWQAFLRSTHIHTHPPPPPPHTHPCLTHILLRVLTHKPLSSVHSLSAAYPSLTYSPYQPYPYPPLPTVLTSIHLPSHKLHIPPFPTLPTSPPFRQSPTFLSFHSLHTLASLPVPEVSSWATWGQGGRDRTTQREGFQVSERGIKGESKGNQQGEQKRGLRHANIVNLYMCI
jgi:hypothetical protein